MVISQRAGGLDVNRLQNGGTRMELVTRRTIAAGLAVTAFAVLPAVPAWADGASTRAADPQLILSTTTGNMYTIDPANTTDACQHVNVGNSVWTEYSPITIAPDGNVYTSNWGTEGDLGVVGPYTQSSANWANAGRQIGGAAPHDVAGILALDNDTAVATGAYTHVLMKVDLRTGNYTDIGDLPGSPDNGMTWAPDGDLLITVGSGNYLYRLPASVLTGALNGGPAVLTSDWLNLGYLGTEAPARWYNPFSWGSTGYGNVYGLATGPDGSLYYAAKGGQIYQLTRIPRTDDSSRSLKGTKIRDFNGGCDYSGDLTTGMTIDGQWLWAPAATDTPVNIAATAGQPVSGIVTSSTVIPPVSVLVDPATLPAGVSIGTDGTISGTPVAAGNTTARVKVCGQDSCVWKNVVFDVSPGGTDGSGGTGHTGAQKPPPADPTMTLNGSANAPVSGTLPGSAAAAPSTFTVTDPAQLPKGVSIDSSGNLMGIPTSAGTYSIPVKACNATGCTTGTVTLTIGPDQSPCDQDHLVIKRQRRRVPRLLGRGAEPPASRFRRRFVALRRAASRQPRTTSTPSTPSTSRVSRVSRKSRCCTLATTLGSSFR
jgi:hypothetical protein